MNVQQIIHHSISPILTKNNIQVSPSIVRFTKHCFAIAILPKSTVQYNVADFSF
jgi:hypothetical protein